MENALCKLTHSLTLIPPIESRDAIAIASKTTESSSIEMIIRSEKFRCKLSFKVLEMYSSGGDLHLELPSGGHEADTSVWQIPPYHTKQVMKANFLARAESNHTAYIR